MLTERMIRAVRLDPSLYEEVRRDWNANGQAFAVVLIVAACAVIGSATLNPVMLFNAALSEIGGWLFWCLIASMMGGLFGRRTDFQEMMRPVAFAQAPGVLRLFVLLPGAGLGILLVAWIWTTIASVIAVREAMNVDTKQAVMTALASTAVVTVIGLITGATMNSLNALISRI